MVWGKNQIINIILKKYIVGQLCYVFMHCPFNMSCATNITMYALQNVLLLKLKQWLLQNAYVPYLLWLWTFIGSEANAMP